jgi:hypothetical protein
MRRSNPPPCQGLRFARPSKERKKGKQITMKQFIKDILRQLFGVRLKKSKLIITYWANVQKTDLGLDMNTIQEVFETGRESKSKVKSYGGYSISVSYKWDENKHHYVITSVRRFENQEKPINKYPGLGRRWK